MERPDAIHFPPVEFADEDGLLAVGGNLSPDTLLTAYKQGIFPWYNEDEPILWWCPDPRFVLFPEELHVSGSMEKVFRRQKFLFTIDTAFREVINQCSIVPREGQDGTWITPEIKEAYIKLHQLGYAHSAETWQDGLLVGGMYGVRLGKVFFGESMFSKRSNASKFAFLRFVQELQNDGVELIDCQVYSSHLQTLGARMISRTEFCARLEKLVIT
jgi:leucyl/phenylalanyl-tRNA--protein transferase